MACEDMTTTAKNYEHPPGRYWVEVLEPVVDGGGVADERWSEPLPATFDEQGNVLVDGWGPSPLCFDWRVVERAEPVPPVPRFAVGDWAKLAREIPAFSLARGQRVRVDRVYVNPEAYDVTEFVDGQPAGGCMLQPQDLDGFARTLVCPVCSSAVFYPRASSGYECGHCDTRFAVRVLGCPLSEDGHHDEHWMNDGVCACGSNGGLEADLG